jgi:hypothetical protein
VTKPKQSRYPVSSFGPELMALLIKASRERVEIPCNSMKQMKNLQMRIHMLRGAMSREKHAQYALVTKVHTSCTWDFDQFPSKKGRGKQFPIDATGCKLLLYPKDSQFAELLAKAGIQVEDIKSAEGILDELPVPPTPNDPTIESGSQPDKDEPNFNPDEIYGRFK